MSEPVTDEYLSELESAYSDIAPTDASWLLNCAARDVLRLIAEIRRLRGELESVTAERDHARLWVEQ